MRLKAGVQLDGVHYLLFYAATVYDILHQQVAGSEGTLTSARDSQHAQHSWHYQGRAIDVRTRDLPIGADQFAIYLAQFLPAPTFRIIVEPDHIHIEAPAVGEPA